EGPSGRAHGRRRSLRESRNGHLRHERRTGAGPRLDGQPAADERDPLAHTYQAEAVFARASGIEADSVVLDDSRDGGSLPTEDDAHVAGARMLDDVRQ